MAKQRSRCDKKLTSDKRREPSGTLIANQQSCYSKEHCSYCPAGTSISFPMDEGKHDSFMKYPKEWWYVNFHLVGCSTEAEYGAFVAFIKIAQNLFFSISDVNQKKIYTDTKFGILTAAKNKLNLCLNGLSNKDYFYTKSMADNLVPFQYKLIAHGIDREQDNQVMNLDVDMHCVKPPMIVGGDGLVHIGNGWSYYYCQTKIEVSGSITVHGTTEDVTGYAWIDHQWGNFNMLPSERVSWEWFSIKLDDLREIVVGDTWWDNTGKRCGNISKGLNLINANNVTEVLVDYKITPLDFWTDPISKRKFASKWRLTEPTKPIDLTINVDFNNQMMPTIGNPSTMKFIARIFPCSSFWEGSCSVSGTIGSVSTSGKAYTELIHSW